MQFSSTERTPTERRREAIRETSDRLWKRTLEGGISVWLLDAPQAIAEFGLGGVELREGSGEVLEFFVELLLDLAELLHAQRIQVDCRPSVSVSLPS